MSFIRPCRRLITALGQFFLLYFAHDPCKFVGVLRYGSIFRRSNCLSIDQWCCEHWVYIEIIWLSYRTSWQCVIVYSRACNGIPIRLWKRNVWAAVFRNDLSRDENLSGWETWTNSSITRIRHGSPGGHTPMSGKVSSDCVIYCVFLNVCVRVCMWWGLVQPTPWFQSWLLLLHLGYKKRERERARELAADILREALEREASLSLRNEEQENLGRKVRESLWSVFASIRGRVSSRSASFPPHFVLSLPLYPFSFARARSSNVPSFVFGSRFLALVILFCSFLSLLLSLSLSYFVFSYFLISPSSYTFRFLLFVRFDPMHASHESIGHHPCIFEASMFRTQRRKMPISRIHTRAS